MSNKLNIAIIQTKLAIPVAANEANDSLSMMFFIHHHQTILANIQLPQHNWTEKPHFIIIIIGQDFVYAVICKKSGEFWLNQPWIVNMWAR